tara:strand:+ start:106494 stop:108095 length:1602 start_codon:yes stop_codon:yes gene_type:complete
MVRLGSLKFRRVLLAKKVCVLAAGTGSRMGEYSDLTNKVLLPLENRAILSGILEKFEDREFVIAVGHQAQDVKDYVAMAHPNINVTFVEVENYYGEGSGPGHSLMCCEPYLHEPFLLVCGDISWTEHLDYNEPMNWVGAYAYREVEKKTYCILETKGSEILNIWDKQDVHTLNPTYAHVGLSRIEDYDLFFKGLKRANIRAGEHQYSDGLLALQEEHRLHYKIIPTWMDVGTVERYRRAMATQRDFFDFAKQDEIFYDVDDRVIKYFKDPQTLKDRVKRAEDFGSLFPTIDQVSEHFYSYKKVPGRTLYDCLNVKVFEKLLDFLEEKVWKSVPVSLQETKKLCHEFYQRKTHERVERFLQKHPEGMDPTFFNGQSIAPGEILSGIPWDLVEKGLPVRFHGDLQFENILYDKESDQFTVIDIRQNFAGRTDVGDLYYDLGKLWMGMNCNLSLVRKKQFHFGQSAGEIEVEFPDVSLEIQSRFAAYVRSKGLNFDKVKLLSGIIMINMAPLHSTPLDYALWYQGLRTVDRYLKEN